MITTLRIVKEYKSSMEIAIKWYSIISVLNNFNWRPMDIEILAFTAVKGDISSGGRKTAFCEMFNTTKSTLANYITALSKSSFLIKIDGKIKVHPQLMMDFDTDIYTHLKIIHGN